jgi:C4-dicarboxylate-specific signal transduction histidine kinase
VQAIGDDPGIVEINMQRQPHQLSISVSNTGMGFSPEFLQQGIRPFLSLKEKGSGLGLVMVQRFAREQQGILKLENDEKGHARVSLNLPLAPAA